MVLLQYAPKVRHTMAARMVERLEAREADPPDADKTGFAYLDTPCFNISASPTGMSICAGMRVPVLENDRLGEYRLAHTRAMPSAMPR